MKILKVDKADNSKLLEGAKFKIYGSFNDASSVNDTISIDGKMYYFIKDTEPTNSEGEVIIDKLLEDTRDSLLSNQKHQKDIKLMRKNLLYQLKIF